MEGSQIVSLYLTKIFVSTKHYWLLYIICYLYTALLKTVKLITYITYYYLYITYYLYIYLNSTKDYNLPEDGDFSNLSSPLTQKMASWFLYAWWSINYLLNWIEGVRYIILCTQSLYNDKGVNTSRIFNNYKYISSLYLSTKTHLASTNRS